MRTKDIEGMANSVGPDQTVPIGNSVDQTAPTGAVWSGSALFAHHTCDVSLIFRELPEMSRKHFF